MSTLTGAPQRGGPISLLRRLTAGSSAPPNQHRDVQGGAFRASVLGAGDGLITNVSLVLGVAGASSSGAAVRLAGVAGLLAGSFSMAAGELVSVRAQQELVEREIAAERRELAEEPEAEQRELAAMYRARGVADDDAETVARILSSNPHVALDTHTRLELGVDPNQQGQASKVAAVSFMSFGLGALLPLLPWFFTKGTPAVVLSVVIGAIAALSLGALIGSFSGRGRMRIAFRQLAAAGVSAAVTFGVGSLLGVGTS